MGYRADKWKRKTALTGTATATYRPEGVVCHDFEIAVEWTAGTGGTLTVETINRDAKTFDGYDGAITFTQADGDRATTVSTLHGAVKVSLAQGTGATCTVYCDAAPVYDVTDDGKAYQSQAVD